MTTIRRVPDRTTPTLRETRPRVTPQPPSRRFAETLGEGAHAVLAGVEQAAGLLPGGAAVAAAIRGNAGASPSTAGAGVAQPGATGSAGSTGSVAPASDGSLQSMLSSSSNSAEELLMLQHQMAMEQRTFQTASNVMKARHDTSKAVIQNVR